MIGDRLSHPRDVTLAQTAGAFVAVVGPSGVGKDSLINYAREHFRDRSDLVFARRVITRPTDPASEDHDSVSEAEFDALVQEDRLVLWWGAHGLRYGLPRSVGTAVDSGKVVVANVSRQSLKSIRRQFKRHLVIAVSAHREVVASRLAARGREDTQTVRLRLSRVVDEELAAAADTVRIDNSGPLPAAGERLISLLADLVEARPGNGFANVEAR
ncbi:MAG: phosphonate metabolism protein/1,5-bisphosphokinase (PRPP-forming) PhnN [Gammaproteobacteria bacterium]